MEHALALIYGDVLGLAVGAALFTRMGFVRENPLLIAS